MILILVGTSVNPKNVPPIADAAGYPEGAAAVGILDSFFRRPLQFQSRTVQEMGRRAKRKCRGELDISKARPHYSTGCLVVVKHHLNQKGTIADPDDDPGLNKESEGSMTDADMRHI